MWISRWKSEKTMYLYVDNRIFRFFSSLIHYTKKIFFLQYKFKNFLFYFILYTGLSKGQISGTVYRRFVSRETILIFFQKNVSRETVLCYNREDKKKKQEKGDCHGKNNCDCKPEGRRR